MIELPPPVQRMIDATNAGDSEAFVATFTDDAVLIDWGKEFHGADGVAAWNESDNIGRDSRFRPTAVERDGDAWIVTLEVTGKGFNGTSDARFSLDAGKISRMVITP